jgi:C-terminal processing protease CtpA/Prc
MKVVSGRPFTFAAVGVGGLLLLALCLVSFFWVETFHYLGCGFPFFLGFLTVPFLAGLAGRRGRGRLSWLVWFPPTTAALLYAAGVIALSGRLRFVGWLRDVGPLFLVWAAAFALAAQAGYSVRGQGREPAIRTAAFVVLALVAAGGLQLSLPPYAGYFYLKEGVSSFFPEDASKLPFEQALAKVSSYIEGRYPYLEYKKVDWDLVKAEAEAQVRNVRDASGFLHVVGKLLASLNDGHVKLMPGGGQAAQGLSWVGAVGARVEGRTVVLAVDAGSPAEAAGLRPGVEIIAVNGAPFDRPKFSLYGPRGGRISVAWLDESGGGRTADIEIPVLGWRRAEKPVAWRLLPGGYGYVRISSMSSKLLSFVPAFDRALERLWDTDGLVIDIRYNTGGAIVLTDQILGRLTGKPVFYGGMLDRQGRYGPLFVVPRRPVYLKPVVILINEWNASAAEFFAYAASSLESVTLAGRRTAGVVSSPSKVMKLPGGARAQLVSSGLADRDRSFVVEDTGIQPDILVDYSLVDLRSGQDTDLAAAVRILQARLK